MSALFPKSANTLMRIALITLATMPAVAIGGLLLYVRSDYGTGQGHPYEQPVQFDHRHHVVDVGIDCRYCHASVETGPLAGIPSTQVCMGCHNQVWNKSPYLDPVRDWYFTGKPIPWERVHNLPDFVYFDHSIHVNKGVGCVSCHGRVDTMASVQQVEPLTMSWCLDCHRSPEKNLRPLDQITSTVWAPPSDPKEAEALAQKLAADLNVHTRTSCSTCHR